MSAPSSLYTKSCGASNTSDQCRRTRRVSHSGTTVARTTPPLREFTHSSSTVCRLRPVTEPGKRFKVPLDRTLENRSSRPSRDTVTPTPSGWPECSPYTTDKEFRRSLIRCQVGRCDSVPCRGEFGTSRNRTNGTPVITGRWGVDGKSGAHGGGGRTGGSPTLGSTHHEDPGGRCLVLDKGGGDEVGSPGTFPETRFWSKTISVTSGVKGLTPLYRDPLPTGGVVSLLSSLNLEDYGFGSRRRCRTPPRLLRQ